jgi:hypothetical protein
MLIVGEVPVREFGIETPQFLLPTHLRPPLVTAFARRPSVPEWRPYKGIVRADPGLLNSQAAYS